MNNAKYFAVSTEIKNGDQFFSKTFATCEEAKKEAYNDYAHLTDREKKTHTLMIMGWEDYDPNGFDSEYADPIFCEVYKEDNIWVANREAGNLIGKCDTIEEAKKLIEQYEEEDKADGAYTPNYYDIVDGDTRCSLVR